MKRRQLVGKYIWFHMINKGKFIDADGYYGYQCFTEGNMVLLESGIYKDIKDIVVGDRVYNYDGSEINTVTDVLVSEAETINLSFGGTLDIQTTNEHPFYVQKLLRGGNDRRHQKYSSPERVHANKLSGYDLAIIPTVKHKEINLTDDELLYLGYRLGDGTIGYNKGRTSIRICSSNKNAKYNFIQSLNIQQNTNEYKNQPGTFDSILRKREHKQLTEIIKMCGRKGEKGLPLFFSKEQYKKIIEGYLMADGSLYTGSINRYRAQTISKKLALSIHYAAIICGYASNITKIEKPKIQFIQGRKVNCADVAYNIIISILGGRAMNIPVINGGYMWSTIYKNTPHSKNSLVYNISTDGDHTYTINNIGVHNCVDYIRSYCKDVLNYIMPSLPKARELSNKHMTPDKFFELEVGVDDLQMGDIVSVDLIPKNKYGHIFTIYKVTKDGYFYVDQNGIGGASEKNTDGSYKKIKGNGVERRFAKWSKFKILKAFRFKTT